MDKFETVIEQARDISKQILRGRNHILKSKKTTDRLCNLALLIAIAMPFFFVAKVWIIYSMCWICIIAILVIVNRTQKKWSICIKELNKRINEFQYENKKGGK